MEVVFSVLHQLSMAGFVALVLTGAWTDARSLRIPNWISLTLLVLFLVASLGAGMEMNAIAMHLAVGTGALVAGFSLFALGIFGGGDAKLFAAIALWLGWPLVLKFAIAVVLIGGGVAIVALALRKGLGLWPDWLVRSAAGLFEEGKAIPYGIAISAGALVMMPAMDLLPGAWIETAQVLFASG